MMSKDKQDGESDSGVVFDDFDVGGFMSSLEGDPKSTTLRLHGTDGPRDIVISRATATNMVDIIDVIKGLMNSLGMKSIAELGALEGFMSRPTNVLQMLQDILPRVRALSIKLSDLSTEQWDDLDFDELLILVWAQWQVNEQFFMKRLPKLLRLLGMSESDGKPANGPQPPVASPAGDAASRS